MSYYDYVPHLTIDLNGVARMAGDMESLKLRDGQKKDEEDTTVAKRPQ
ncbi:hypothetical protein ACDX78_18650 [Virgibacillus oceani]